MAPVLVVDDDEDIRLALASALEDEGYEVELAVHGLHALEVLARCGRPCLVLLDMMMPIMHGEELLDRLRAHAEFADVPVVIMTASPPPEKLKGSTVLRKPVRLDEVLREVERSARAAERCRPEIKGEPFRDVPAGQT